VGFRPAAAGPAGSAPDPLIDPSDPSGAARARSVPDLIIAGWRPVCSFLPAGRAARFRASLPAESGRPPFQPGFGCRPAASARKPASKPGDQAVGLSEAWNQHRKRPSHAGMGDRAIEIREARARFEADEALKALDRRMPGPVLETVAPAAAAFRCSGYCEVRCEALRAVLRPSALGAPAERSRR